MPMSLEKTAVGALVVERAGAARTFRYVQKWSSGRGRVNIGKRTNEAPRELGRP